MYNYCMSQQNEGYEKAIDLFQKYSGIQDIDAIVAFAAGKWLKRSEYQYDMVAYEIEQQGDAFLDVSYDYKSGKYSKDAVKACIQKWISTEGPQWDMVAYCLKN